MRIWSIHPKYLDSKGLVALWRETLLAKKVLLNLTKGYKQHPQLIRFKNTKNPVKAIDTYLHYIYEESCVRNYQFDGSKYEEIDKKIKIEVSKRQIDFEFKHLLKKLKYREKAFYEKFLSEKEIDVNPIFKIVPGDIEIWEKYKTGQK